jgi:hypothetical protein
MERQTSRLPKLKYQRMNQSGSTVLARPVDRQFNAKTPALVGLFRPPELIGPHRTRRPSS